jgi:acidic leucine-rich nuclear phosphoprotein 32 family protein B
MDEIWERAVETALEGQTDKLAARTLTLDGAVKCIQGRLPAPSLFEKFVNLQHLSIANIGVSTLEQFPRLGNLEKLILSDNRISGGLEFLVEAGLDSLRDIDLSNNRIQYIEDLAPLAKLRLVSLDLYECPVTRLKDYRSRVFGLISSLKYLDKMDAEENERPESDDEEEDDDEEDEEDDPGSGEVDGEERPCMMNNGHSEVGEGIVDVDEEEESEADEEETETGREINGVSQNGFRVEVVDRDEEGEGGDDDEGDESGEEEIDEDDDDDDDEDDDVVEVHEIGDDSDENDDGVEYEEEDDDDGEDGEGEEDEEEVDNDEGDLGEPESTGRLTSTEGEIDGHEQGEDVGEEDDNGETGEEEQGVEVDGEFDDEEDGEEEVRCSGILC